MPCNPHASLHAQLCRALANLFRVRARHTLFSCPLHGPSVSVSARCVHVSAVHVRVVSWCSPVAQTLLPVARHEVHHTSRARPATHVPALSVHGPDVRVPSSSVYDPAVHFAPGLCTAQPRNPNVSFHAQFRHALADVFCALPHHAPPCCPLHGPAWASPPVPCAAPQCTWPRAVYGLAVQSSRLVACTASPGTCQPVPCSGRHTLPSCPLHGPTVSLSARSVHGSAVHVPAVSVCGPAANCPLARCTAPGSPHVPCTAPRRTSRPYPCMAPP